MVGEVYEDVEGSGHWLAEKKPEGFVRMVLELWRRCRDFIARESMRVNATAIAAS